WRRRWARAIWRRTASRSARASSFFAALVRWGPGAGRRGAGAGRCRGGAFGSVCPVPSGSERPSCVTSLGDGGRSAVRVVAPVERFLERFWGLRPFFALAAPTVLARSEGRAGLGRLALVGALSG